MENERRGEEGSAAYRFDRLLSVLAGEWRLHAERRKKDAEDEEDDAFAYRKGNGKRVWLSNLTGLSLHSSVTCRACAQVLVTLRYVTSRYVVRVQYT